MNKGPEDPYLDVLEPGDPEVVLVSVPGPSQPAPRWVLQALEKALQRVSPEN